jgi:4-hydroxy-2-oxoheptanedioate aldolase
MKPNRVKELWRKGEPVAVGWCSTVDPFLTEAMVRAGFDALILDWQHGMGIDSREMVTWLQQVGQTDTVPFVRTPWNEPVYAQWALDAGAMGIIIPMVDDAEQARKAIGACRYPPLGYRSYAPNRASLLAMDYFARTNEDIVCLVMLESLAAIDNVEAIGKLPGCDGYFIGPIDLGVSMGLPPTTDGWNEQHAAAVQRVLDFARSNGQMAGVFALSPEQAARRFHQGFNFNPTFADVFSLAPVASRAASQFRELARG